MERILKRKKTSRAAGLEVSMGQDGPFSFEWMVIESDGNDVSIKNSGGGPGAPDKDAVNLRQGLPVQLVITGKGVIVKRIEVGQENPTVETVLSDVLPNARGQDFFCTWIEAGQGLLIAAICRKQPVDDLVRHLEEKGLLLTGFYLGPMVTGNLTRLAGIENGRITASGHTLDIRNFAIIDCEATPGAEAQPLLTGKEQIPARSLASFAAALNHLVQGRDHEGTVPKGIGHGRDQYRYRNKYVTLGKSVLIISFAVLLINFFLFNTFNRKYNQLSEEMSQHRGLLSTHARLEAGLKSKKQLLERSGLANAGRISYYADRLAGSVPGNITLVRMQVHPLKKVKAGEKVQEFESSTIVLEGTCRKSTVFNAWLEQLAGLEWVENIPGFTYENDKTGNNSQAEFTIEITLRQ
ncbi:MAG: hypothetical protein JXA03_10535 [Bacteroidales bacterium]|nr:hypothetical protein [Bacteroidales bacterium]